MSYAISPAARTLTTAKGRSVTTTLSDRQAVDIIRSIRSKFAQDLAQKARGRSGLSHDQIVWAHILALETLQPQAAPEAIPVTNDTQAIFDLFAAAAKHLKYPAVRLLAGSQPVRMSLGGPRSKYAGQVLVTDGEKYPDNKFFGRVDTDGKFHPARNVPDEVVVLLIAFAADPAKTAAEYGKLTGRCCFCERALTDQRSTEVGYGPICAGHYSLPWG